MPLVTQRVHKCEPGHAFDWVTSPISRRFSADAPRYVSPWSIVPLRYLSTRLRAVMCFCVGLARTVPVMLSTVLMSGLVQVATYNNDPSICLYTALSLCLTPPRVG